MKLIILDRDGVINHDSPNYIKTPAEWIAIPGSLAAIAQLNRAGYQVVIATNQSGLARGLYNEVMLQQIHQKMFDELAQYGGVIDHIFYCPHGPDDHCACRKPKPGLLHQIAAHYQIDLTGVPFVGDSMRDIEAARAAACQPILVCTGNGAKIAYKLAAECPVFDDLAAAVKDLLATEL